jgi:hypothetical protein
MSKPDPRHYAQQRDFERQLLNFVSPEAIEILARVTATIMARDPSQFGTQCQALQARS